MGLQEIVNYVMNTPENTNSAVLKSVVKNNLVWEDIKNKPFGEETITVTDTLTWDGNTDGLASAGIFYKVSDIVLTPADVSNGVSIIMSTGGVFSIPAEAAQSMFSDGFASFFEDAVINVPYDGCDTLGIPFPEAGIYFISPQPNFFAKSFTVNGYKGFKPMQKTVVHPIDKKYLPESLRFYSEEKEEVVIDIVEKEVTGTYYDDTQFYTSWEQEPLPSFVGGDTYIVEFCGGKHEAYAENFGFLIFETEDGRYEIHVSHGNPEYVAFYGPNKGVTALPFTTSLKVTRKYEEVKPINGKYLPREVQPMKILVESIQKSSDDQIMIKRPVYFDNSVPVRSFPQQLQECLTYTLAPVYVYFWETRVGEIFHYDSDTSIAYGVFFDYSTGIQYPKAKFYT